jgi:hypothetical protein
MNAGIFPEKESLLAHLDSLPPVCPLKIFLGLKCAFCGMTHAFVHLLYLDFHEAYKANALSIPLATGLLLAPLFMIIRYPWRPKLSSRGVVLSILVLGVYAVFRNL